MDKKDVGIFSRCFGIVGKLLFLSLVSSYFVVGVAVAAAVQECSSTGAVLASPQGIIMELTGDVKATIGKGAPCPAGKGQTIVSDTVITTGEKSTVVLRFADGQGVSLQANSTFHVQQYVFDQANAAKSNIVFALLKGGARFVTGLIGQKHKEAIKITAGTITIGIRGTAFTVAITAGPASAGGGVVVGTVTSGSITLGGTTFVAGQSFAASVVGGTLSVAPATAAQLAAAVAPAVPAAGVVAIPAGVTAGTATVAGAAAAGVGAAAAAGAGVLTPTMIAAAAAVAAAVAVIASQSTTSTTGTTGTTGTSGTTGSTGSQ